MGRTQKDKKRVLNRIGKMEQWNDGILGPIRSPSQTLDHASSLFYFSGLGSLATEKCVGLDRE
jgi:hypothetical protein